MSPLQASARAWTSISRNGNFWQQGGGTIANGIAWCSGQPDGVAGQEDCAMLQPQCPDSASQTGVIDTACSSKAAVLCSRQGGCGEWLACLCTHWRTGALLQNLMRPLLPLLAAAGWEMP
jgi:hypothetical protein